MAETASAVVTAADPVPQSPNFRRLLLIDIGLPLLTVIALERSGAAPLMAYAAASLFPLGSILAAWRGRRSVDIVGIGVVIGIVSGLTLSFLTADPRFALLRAAPGFLLFGLACFGSLATTRPLMFFVARAVSAGSDPASTAAWNRRLDDLRFQRAMRRLTLVWGSGALLDAAVAVAIAFLLPAQIALIAEPGTAFVILAALFAWTRAFQRRARNIEALSQGE